MFKTHFILASLYVSLFLLWPLKTFYYYNFLPVENSKLVNYTVAVQNKPVTNLNKVKMLKLVNNLRSTGRYCGGSFEQPATPLVWSEKLERAARFHSLDMYRNNYLSHQSKDGTPFYIRIKRQSYNYMTCAENIALGYESEEAVMEGWTNSEGHCRNFMNDLYSEIGIARTGNYWVMVLAYPDNFVQ
jgi:uncharacterized protein YkwD